MTLIVLWLILAAAAGAILFSSRYLVSSADVIADRTGLGRSFIGVVLLATATSLPELVTGVSSILLVDEPDLAAGDAFGSNLVNLLIIGIMDLVWRNGPILTSVARPAIVVGLLGIAVIAVAILAMIVHGASSFAGTWPISPVSVLMFAVFVVGMYVIYRQEDTVETLGHEEGRHSKAPLSRAVVFYTLAMAGIVGAAVVLAEAGGRLADEMGWEASFVGTQFLAISTSLPELAASYAAIRIGAPEFAIANLLGSNLFNMGFVLFLDDVAYVDGALWTGIADVHLTTAVFAVVMTGVVLVAILGANRVRPHRLFTWEAIGLITLYAGASVIVFNLA